MNAESVLLWTAVQVLVGLHRLYRDIWSCFRLFKSHFSVHLKLQNILGPLLLTINYSPWISEILTMIIVLTSSTLLTANMFGWTSFISSLLATHPIVWFGLVQISHRNMYCIWWHWLHPSDFWNKSENDWKSMKCW